MKIFINLATNNPGSARSIVRGLIAIQENRIPVDRMNSHVASLRQRMNNIGMDDSSIRDIFSLNGTELSELSTRVISKSDAVQHTDVFPSHLRRMFLFYLDSEKLRSLDDQLSLLENYKFQLFPSDEPLKEAGGRNAKKRMRMYSRLFPHLISVGNPLPFLANNTTMYRNGLPLLGNRTELGDTEELYATTGICLLGHGKGEVKAIDGDGKVHYLDWGRDRQPVIEGTEKLEFPKGPILESMVNYLFNIELAKAACDNGIDGKVRIWLPTHEYSILTKEMLLDEWLSRKIVKSDDVDEALQRTSNAHKCLISKLTDEVGLDPRRVEILDTGDPAVLKHLNELRSGLDLGFIDKTYGHYELDEKTRPIYELLVTEHLEPVLTGHIEVHTRPSPEIYVALHALQALKGNLKNKVAFLFHPTVPSIGLDHPRDYSTPSTEKIYLGADDVEKKIGMSGRGFVPQVMSMLTTNGYNTDDPQKLIDILSPFCGTVRGAYK